MFNSSETLPGRPLLVSCLCVTEDRHAFIPWLLWCFDRQTWAHKELLIVDSSRSPIALPERSNVRVLRMEPGTPVATKRNEALRAARGSAVGWFDDDDWQHPLRLQQSASRVSDTALVIGPRAAWLVDAFTERVWHYEGLDRNVLFNGCLVATEVAQSVEFDSRRRRASDTLWLAAVLETAGSSRYIATEPNFFWLYHGRNLSLSPRGSRHLRFLSERPASELRERLGASAWGDTSRELGALRERIAATGAPQGVST